ncbi:hypothetical protein GCK72_016407 [Caenorhabditis remanei]|uniref:Uncharacterized protein n=1 Tax=Caenorhabditis remanei TaxID=31234 RepID=A0A6A5G563_CAERE|nr:hypothetical protein GCK72_016407 [Caenorhabditis remanei]KAF1749862.1 hypothetical protein GCK72_016407 [Caenorhabditis remanei]
MRIILKCWFPFFRLSAKLKYSPCALSLSLLKHFVAPPAPSARCARNRWWCSPSPAQRFAQQLAQTSQQPTTPPTTTLLSVSPVELRRMTSSLLSSCFLELHAYD